MVKEFKGASKSAKPKANNAKPFSKAKSFGNKAANNKENKNVDKNSKTKFNKGNHAFKKAVKEKIFSEKEVFDKAVKIEKSNPVENNGDKAGERIAKVIARSGYCSRRDAEKIIEEGRVKVNGKEITSPALNVTLADKITIDNEPIAEAEETRLWVYHKPAGLVTTHSDPDGRPTVFENLPEDIGRVISIGRLDLTSEGLLLLTNDGELARLLELPLSGIERVYRARAFGEVTQEKLNQLQDGVIIDGVHYGAIDAILERDNTKNAWIRVVLREGKNREVRKVLAALGLQVNRLIRVTYGEFELGLLERGELMEVPEGRVKKVFNKLLKLSDKPRKNTENSDASKNAPLIINTEEGNKGHRFGRNSDRKNTEKSEDRPRFNKERAGGNRFDRASSDSTSKGRSNFRSSKPYEKSDTEKGSYEPKPKVSKKGWAKATPDKSRKVGTKSRKSFERKENSEEATSFKNTSTRNNIGAKFGDKKFGDKKFGAKPNNGKSAPKKLSRRELERQPLETAKSLSSNKAGKSFKKTSKRQTKPTK